MTAPFIVHELEAMSPLALFSAAVDSIDPLDLTGTVRRVGGDAIEIGGFSGIARIGDLVRIHRRAAGRLTAEIVALGGGTAHAMPYGPVEGLREGDEAFLERSPDFRPDISWLGQVIDAFGRRLDGTETTRGLKPQALRAPPPPATARRRTGARLTTGLAVLDTMLPLVRGQRIGLFAGSGVGKSRLLARLATRMEADVVVVGLIGERGREVREFVEETLGGEAMKRCVVIAATSDQPAAIRRRASWSAMATAEYFRDRGANVLLLFDSLTRTAEAHREVALTAGEAASLRGFPPSTAATIASLVERSGPGPVEGMGDITAVFTVLVAGSDMDEPVADIVRGVLDGHVVLAREIAERGRFPAIDVRRSVSRSLPDAASADENALIAKARGVFGTYEKVLPMLQVGLYRAGGDPATDYAVEAWPRLDGFCTQDSASPVQSFASLDALLASDPQNEERKSDAVAEGPKPDDAP